MMVLYYNNPVQNTNSLMKFNDPLLIVENNFHTKY